MASFATEMLVQSLTRRPDIAERFATDREGLFKEFEIPEAEREALRQGVPPALAGIGLHPILQIHFFIGSRSPVAAGLNGNLLDRLGAN